VWEGEGRAGGGGTSLPRRMSAMGLAGGGHQASRRRQSQRPRWPLASVAADVGAQLRAADAQADSAINAHADTCLVKSQYDG